MPKIIACDQCGLAGFDVRDIADAVEMYNPGLYDTKAMVCCEMATDDNGEIISR